MKKLLKLSATALIIAGANMLFSQSALACSSTDFACQQQQQIQWQLQNDPNYCNYGYNPNCSNNSGYSNRSRSNSSYQMDFLSLMWTKSGEPYFYKTFYIVSGAFDYASAENDGMNECNKSANRRPCQLAVSTTYKGCIAVAAGESKYGFAGNTCDEAKDEALNYCQARDGNPYACKIIQTKKP